MVLHAGGRRMPWSRRNNLRSFFGPPRPVPAAQPHDQPLDLPSGLVRASLRTAAALAQSRGAFPTVTLPPLVAGLPTDVKVRAKFRKREAARGRETDKPMLLFHEGFFVPGHSLKV